MKNEKQNLLLSAPKAAALLGVSTDTFKAVAEQRLRPVKLHDKAQPRYRRADVEALAAVEAA